VTVRIDVPPDAAWRWSSSALGAFAAMALAAWSGLRLGVASPVIALGLAAAGIGGAVFARRALRAPVGVLRWDGQSWWWRALPASGVGHSGDEIPGRVRVAIDLGRWMLLRFDDAASATRSRGSRWLPLSALAAGSDWPAARARLLSRRMTGPRAVANRPGART
jgi:hypothetical protein